MKQQHWSIGKTQEREAAVAASMKQNGVSGITELLDSLIEEDAMARENKPQNVHYIETNDKGQEIYGVGIWSDSNGQYTAPLDASTRKLTGCYAEFSRKPIGRMTLKKARQEARKLWGYVRSR